MKIHVDIVRKAVSQFVKDQIESCNETISDDPGLASMYLGDASLVLDYMDRLIRESNNNHIYTSEVYKIFSKMDTLPRDDILSLIRGEIDRPANS